VARQIWERCLAHHDEQAKTRPHDGVAFVGAVADSLVVREGEPTTRAYFIEPNVVRAGLFKVRIMFFNVQASSPKNPRELVSQLPIREENVTQAAWT
jgi:hypothetical protein